MWLEPVQTSLEQGVPLAGVTFAVVDLETTGGSPTDAAITEIGAVTMRGGERLGTFQTLVSPGQPIPPYVSHLTGIDDRMVSDAPPIEAVLPSFLEFVRGSVFVAHNARFDASFLNAALGRLDHPPLPSPVICTAKLARRIVWPDVPNVRLRTLARYFRTRVQPSHRALADAEATAEVLDGLLDLGGRLGICTLGDLVLACSARGRPNFGKIVLADSLPSGAGVYLFRAADGRILYVGKSKNVRARVKSYFYGDGRKKVQDLLGEVASVDAVATPGGELDALVVESRLIGLHEPPYNRHGKRWRSYAYLKIDVSEAWPRVKTARTPTPVEGSHYLGPFPGAGRARLVKEALEEAFDVRRCTRSMGRRTRFAPCALADMGRCQAPCDDRTTPERYASTVDDLIEALAAPGSVLQMLEGRMIALAEAERYEEAGLARDRIRALAEAVWRARVDRWLCAGRLVLRGPDGERIELREGSLAGSHADPGPVGRPVARERADELAAVRSWIVRHRVTLVDADPPPYEPVAGGRELARLRRLLAQAELPPIAQRRGAVRSDAA
ncbi:MAG: DEDD exonuclease domain-containing protein [Actinomycetota bacterium]